MRSNDHRVMLDRCRSLVRTAMESVSAPCPTPAAIAGPLSADELRQLGHCSPRLLTSMSRALAHLPTPASAIRRHVAGGASPRYRCGK